jgi:hypothetical protein
MRRCLSVTAGLLLAGAFIAPRFVQAQQVIITHEMTNQDLDLTELQAFQQLIDNNPKMARRLAANPRLAENDGFLRRWPELNGFFSKYPGSKERFVADPGNYLPDVNMHRGHAMRASDMQTESGATPSAAGSPGGEASPTAAAPETTGTPALPALPPSPNSPPHAP